VPFFPSVSIVHSRVNKKIGEGSMCSFPRLKLYWLTEPFGLYIHIRRQTAHRSEAYYLLSLFQSDIARTYEHIQITNYAGSHTH